jgi:endonuclease YncB( thermonuclease family)
VEGAAWFKLQGKATRVVDGDTIHVRVGNRTEKVRLIGIDAPEVGQCFADEATADACSTESARGELRSVVPRRLYPATAA